METFDKHGWLKAVQASRNPKFTDRDFRIGFVICNQFTRRDGKGWVVELDAIVDAIPGRPNVECLKKTLTKFRKAGYLVETYTCTGGVGIKAKRSHNLVKPVTTESQVTTEPVIVESVTRDSGIANPGFYSLEPVILESAETAPEQPKGPPKGTLEGTSKGSSQGTARACADCGKTLDGQIVQRDDGRSVCPDCPPFTFTNTSAVYDEPPW